MEFNKKAISPVVATALLLVVAVVAVVGFQTWFQTYQSGLNTQVEQQSQTGSAVSIERLEEISSSEATAYIQNSGVNDISDANVSISGQSCSTVQDLTAENVTSVSIDGCDSLTQDDSYDVIVRTNDGVFSEEQILR